MAPFKEVWQCFLVVIVILTHLSKCLPRLEFDERVKRIIQSEDVDGYEVATIHAVDPETNVETRQTRRDIYTHAVDSMREKQMFSLLLASGKQLRMSVERTSIDISGAMLTEINQEGNETVKAIEPRDCFFSGPLEGEEEGVVNLAMCDGDLMGSILTNARDYDLQTLHLSQENEDDVMRVLVTWRNNKESDTEVVDGFEIPDDNDTDTEASSSRRSVSDRNAKVDIGVYLDRFYLENIDYKLDIYTNEKIVDLVILKWSGVAQLLSKKSQVGWDLKLRLASIVIMWSDPAYYRIESYQKIGERMKKICKGTKSENFDHVMIHTGQTSDIKRSGVAFVSGLCRRGYRCAAVRPANRNFRTELHEFGHSLGLPHDGQMWECDAERDQTRGFMGGNRDHFRPCYKTRLDKTLENKKCIF